MNRIKHMKHKKNTRRRHKSRNKTRKTRKPYKRCRTRSQRGGTTKEELLKEILAQYKGSIIPFPSYFIKYETFNNFLDVYGESELQRVVCGDYSEEAIRLHENQHLTKIKQAVAKFSNPIPKIIFIKDLFLTPKFINSWTDFVISLKNSVDARYSADFKQRMDALKEDPLLVRPPSAAAAQSRPAAARPAAARPAAAIPAIPAHVQQPEPGPSLPEGWTRYGPDHAPFYTNNLTGKSQNEFPTMPAALEKRLAQINNLDYISQDLSPEDNRRAKESGAYLPDIQIPSDMLKERLAAAAKND